jgi:undecaprenyl-diphosphatase
MTTSPGTQARPSAETAKHQARLLPPTRYRHPGDVIRLVIAGLVLAGALAVAITTRATYAGADAAAVAALAPAALPGRVLAGVVLAVLVAAAAAVIVVTLRYHRFRLLAGLAGAAVLASAVLIGFIPLAGGQRPRDLAAGAGQWPWLTGTSLEGPAVLAAAVAVAVAAAPWLSRPWRRASWVTLWLAAAAGLVTGTASPVEAVVAFAAGVAAGAGVLVLFGVPDRRLGPQEIAAALGSAGLPVTGVEPAGVEAKGSRPFVAAAEDGKPLFIKVLGSDQRDADLLYRAYRFIRLREVGDTRPAASLIQAVEHQALAAVMAERAGVAVPAVRQVIKTADGSALLVMDRVDGSSLDQIPVQRLSDMMLRMLWEQVDGLHRARIAHRSLRIANIVADGTGRPWVVDFSFSELGATQRQMALDVAELLASLAAIVGAERAVAAAATVIGTDGAAAAVPLLQPLALSAGTRRAVARQDGLLTQTRAAAAAVSGRQDTQLARLQRVRPRTLLAIAAAAGCTITCCPNWPRWETPGRRCSRRTGPGFRWSSPCRR